MNEVENIQDFLFYNSEDGSIKVQVLVDAETETIWATQKAIAELFGVTKQNISYHLINIFKSGELNPDTVVKEILITAQSGARGLSEDKIKYYNLDAIICRHRENRTGNHYFSRRCQSSYYGTADLEGVSERREDSAQ